MSSRSSRARGAAAELFTVQDLVLAPQVIRFRRERWVTPDGQEIIALLPPEVTGHFGPGVVRYVHVAFAGLGFQLSSACHDLLLSSIPQQISPGSFRQPDDKSLLGFHPDQASS